MRPDELPGYLQRRLDHIASEGPTRTAYAMARAYHRELSDVTLVRSSHARGTRTPAAPGEPPAIISGGLKRSLRLWPAVSTGAYRAMSRVKPLIIYARIQELGGVITPKGHPFLRFRGLGGRFVFMRSVKIPKRPYMKPTHVEMVHDGRLRDAAIAEARKVVNGG